MSLADERRAGRRVVIAEAGRGNNYRLLSAYTAGLEAEFRRRGWGVSVARAGEPDFLAALLRHASDPDAIALLGHFFYDLRVSAQNHFGNARISDLFRGRLCAMWADHPFTTFMWPRIQEADPRVLYCPADPGFIDPARWLNPQLARFHPTWLPVLYAPPRPSTPIGQRPIDVLVPLTFRDVGTRERCLADLDTQPPLRRLAEASFERLADDRTTYPFTILRELLQSEFGMPLAALGADRQKQREWLGVFSRVDLIVRNERRVRLVRDLLRNAGSLRVHLVGKLPPELQVGPEVMCEDALDAAALGERMALSRWVVHCHPTYPQAMHERVLTAMSVGCGVISDFAPALAETFREGAEWLHARPGASLDELLAGFDADGTARLASAATAAVAGRFGMPEHVDHLLTGIDARPRP